jgi:hypothetical protein
MRRPLTLDGVSDSLLAEYGLSRGAAINATYRCSHQAAIPVPLGDVIVPASRKLNEEALRDILRGIRENADIDPIDVFREPGATRVTLLDGLHRWNVSMALALPMIPCRHVSRGEAEGGFGYVSKADP